MAGIPCEVACAGAHPVTVHIDRPGGFAFIDNDPSLGTWQAKIIRPKALDTDMALELVAKACKDCGESGQFCPKRSNFDAVSSFLNEIGAPQASTRQQIINAFKTYMRRLPAPGSDNSPSIVTPQLKTGLAAISNPGLLAEYFKSARARNPLKWGR